jgi:hypothetical protein
MPGAGCTAPGLIVRRVCSRLFLGELVSTIARLRFTGCPHGESMAGSRQPPLHEGWGFSTGTMGKLQPDLTNENEQSVGTGSGGHLVPRDRIRGICGAVDAHLSEAFGSADGVRRIQMAAVLR